MWKHILNWKNNPTACQNNYFEKEMRVSITIILNFSCVRCPRFFFPISFAPSRIYLLLFRFSLLINLCFFPLQFSALHFYYCYDNVSCASVKGCTLFFSSFRFWWICKLICEECWKFRRKKKNKFFSYMLNMQIRLGLRQFCQLQQLNWNYGNKYVHI